MSVPIMEVTQGQQYKVVLADGRVIQTKARGTGFMFFPQCLVSTGRTS